MTAMLDYMLEKNSHIIFFIDDISNQSLIQNPSNLDILINDINNQNLIQNDSHLDKLQTESTLKHIFTFASNKPKHVDKSTNKP